MNIIEIGANLGKETAEFNKEDVVWIFEPSPRHIPYLQKKFKDYPNIHIIQKAVSDFNGKAKFNIAKDTYSSSLLDLSDRAKLKNLLEFSETIEVDVINLNKFIIENNITKIDYYKSDAQGVDLKILKSLGDNIKLIKKGKVEVNNKYVNIYENQDNYVDDTIEYLSKYGFSITNVDEILASTKRYDYDLEFEMKKKTILI